MKTGTAHVLLFLCVAALGFERGVALSAATSSNSTAKITPAESVTCHTYPSVTPDTEPERVLYYGFSLQEKMMEKSKLDPQQADSSSSDNFFLYGNGRATRHREFREAIFELTKLRHEHETFGSLGISEDSILMRAMSSVDTSTCDLLKMDTNPSDFDCSDDNIERKLALYFSIKDVTDVVDSDYNSMEKMIGNSRIYSGRGQLIDYWNGKVLKNCSSTADILSNDGVLAAHAQYVTRNSYLQSDCHCCIHSVFDPLPKC